MIQVMQFNEGGKLAEFEFCREALRICGGHSTFRTPFMTIQWPGKVQR